MTQGRAPEGARGGLVALALLGAMAWPGAAARAQSVAAASLGVFGVRGQDEPTAMFELEYRFAPRRWQMRPVVGGAATTDGGSYLRVGAGRDFELADRWEAHLGFGVSSYFSGSGKRLGSGLEFRSALDLTYRLRKDLSLGFTLAHLSNAGLGDFNPGVETLAFTLAWRQPTGGGGRR